MNGFIEVYDFKNNKIIQTWHVQLDIVYINELKKANQEYVITTDKGIYFLTFDSINHKFDQKNVKGYLKDKNTFSIEEFVHEKFLISLNDNSGLLLIFDVRLG